MVVYSGGAKSTYHWYRSDRASESGAILGQWGRTAGHHANPIMAQSGPLKGGVHFVPLITTPEIQGWEAFQNDANLMRCFATKNGLFLEYAFFF
jgi:hypothetical protein